MTPNSKIIYIDFRAPDNLVISQSNTNYPSSIGWDSQLYEFTWWRLQHTLTCLATVTLTIVFHNSIVITTCETAWFEKGHLSKLKPKHLWLLVYEILFDQEVVVFCSSYLFDTVIFGILSLHNHLSIRLLSFCRVKANILTKLTWCFQQASWAVHTSL